MSESSPHDTSLASIAMLRGENEKVISQLRETQRTLTEQSEKIKTLQPPASYTFTRPPEFQGSEADYLREVNGDEELRKIAADRTLSDNAMASLASARIMGGVAKKQVLAEEERRVFGESKDKVLMYVKGLEKKLGLTDGELSSLSPSAKKALAELYSKGAGEGVAPDFSPPAQPPDPSAPVDGEKTIDELLVDAAHLRRLGSSATDGQKRELAALDAKIAIFEKNFVQKG